MEWIFTLEVVNLILDAEFLCHHQLGVSLTRHLLVSVNGEVSLPQMSSSSPSLLSKISSAHQKIFPGTCQARHPSPLRDMWPAELHTCSVLGPAEVCRCEG